MLARKIVARYGEDLTGRSFGVWGLAFKPNTDDMREAPSRALIAELLSRGARVRAYDPVATAEARRVFALDLAGQPEWLERLSFVDEPGEVADQADALVIVTEWKAFKSPDFAALAERWKAPVIFDGRNLYEPLAMRELGIEYHAIGRAHAAQAPAAGRAAAQPAASASPAAEADA